jgi:hypothetical protein
MGYPFLFLLLLPPSPLQWLNILHRALSSSIFLRLLSPPMLVSSIILYLAATRSPTCYCLPILVEIFPRVFRHGIFRSVFFKYCIWELSIRTTWPANCNILIEYISLPQVYIIIYRALYSVLYRLYFKCIFSFLTLKRDSTPSSKNHVSAVSVALEKCSRRKRSDLLFYLNIDWWILKGTEIKT